MAVTKRIKSFFARGCRYIFRKQRHIRYRIRLSLRYAAERKSYVHIRKKDVEETLAHAGAFTEGFFFHGGVLHETSGHAGISFIYRYSDGYKKKFDKVFLEGCTILNDRIYLLTYKDGIAYVLDKDTFAITKQLRYDREGWGLTTDGKHLIASDGTNRLYFMDEEYNTLKTIEVQAGKDRIRNINELQYIDGKILANIWMRNVILTIDSDTGKVLQKTFVHLKNRGRRKNDLNGIAYDGRYVYITGKDYTDIWKISAEKFFGGR